MTTLQDEWKEWEREEPDLSWKIINEISAEVFIQSNITVQEAKRLGEFLINICREDFLDRSVGMIKLLQERNPNPLLNAGLNLAKVAVIDVFESEENKS